MSWLKPPASSCPSDPRQLYCSSDLHPYLRICLFHHPDSLPSYPIQLRSRRKSGSSNLIPWQEPQRWQMSNLLRENIICSLPRKSASPSLQLESFFLKFSMKSLLLQVKSCPIWRKYWKEDWFLCYLQQCFTCLKTVTISFLRCLVILFVLLGVPTLDSYLF